MSLRKFLLRLLARQRLLGKSGQRQGRVASAPLKDVLRSRLLKTRILSSYRDHT
jgi:hypothetical protein